MNEPLTVSALTRSVWHDFRRTWRRLVLFEALFKLLEVWLFVPVVAAILSAVLSRAGHLAVSNQDILTFLLTPAGLLYAALFSTLAVALFFLEQAGIMVLVALEGPVERSPVTQVLRAIFQKTWHIAQLGAVTVAALVLTLLPFVLLAVLTYRMLLTQHDIYFYLKERPPDFWFAASIGGLLLIAAVATTVWLYLPWAFALPILLFENQSVRGALRASRERVRGVRGRVGFFLLGWLLVTLLLSGILGACFRLLAAAVLDNAGERPVARILLLLVAQAGLYAVLSFVLVVGLGLVTRRLYLTRSEQLGLGRPVVEETVPEREKPASRWPRRLAYLAVAVVLLAPLALWAELSLNPKDRPWVLVTAHRGHARAAPENTLSALRKAIESGADYAEIDVHQTADGVVVLLHDRDLRRVAGVSRRLDEVSYEELGKLDVGSWFDPTFAGERVPTLVEAINLCRGRIRMNIEMKFFGPDRRLAQEVARILREQDFESEYLVTSLDYDGLMEAKQHNQRLRIGLIVAQALGDVSRLDVDALSVRADHLSDELLRAAHRQGREVHVWTVNEARKMTRQMNRGVDNLITSDPDLAIRVRAEWANLTEAERLLLASRLLLGLDPWDGQDP
jgi:glycerophosphoryl diester phosphodiesterase